MVLSIMIQQRVIIDDAVPCPRSPSTCRCGALASLCHSLTFVPLLHPLLPQARPFLVGCCVIMIDRRPPKATMYLLSSERQNLDLAKWILTPDQLNFYLLKWIAQINQVICIWKSKLSKNNFCIMFKKEDCFRQYLFPWQVFLIHYFYHLFLFDQNF